MHKYYGTAVGSELNDPLLTLTTKDRMALVTVEVAGETYMITDTSMRVNGGVTTCHRGGAKVGQLGASALERAALKWQARSKAHWPSGQYG